MVEFVDQNGHRFQLDASLEVVVDGEVGYLEGNAHTFAGRMHIYVPRLGYDVTRSLSELESISDAARWWIRGFLAGCEPDVYDYLGIDARLGDVEPTDAEYERWRAFNARYRETGDWPALHKRPRLPLVITDEERAELRIQGTPRPWAKAGERVWVAEGATWVEAVPQPQLVDGEIPGSICAERGYPDLLALQSGWTICLDCAEVTPAE